MQRRTEFFSAAVAVLRSDGSDDVDCAIDWRCDDNVEKFPDGDGSIDDQAELTAVLNREGNIKVVQFIIYCGGQDVSAIGCGETPGGDFAVEKTIASNIVDITWVHEYGHNKGLRLREGATNVMASMVGPGNRFINSAECDAFRNSLLIGQPPPRFAEQNSRDRAVSYSTVNDFGLVYH